MKNSRTMSENKQLNKKQRMLSKITGKQMATNPFVYMDRQLVTTALTRIKLFEKILEVQGSIVECGVYQANSLFIYSHLSSILEPYNFNRKIIGFDTFEGFRSISDKDPNGINEEDFANTNLDHLKT
ncbi:dTDP-6-deoxy-L-hexose 3-O-methyltransferase, partial [Alphaproteobacteria bacterium]|nr:dTDP-6-deoxy-L-hexose 3-O-methyltransferase [Alphaproteobacteria bacterium]